MYEIIIKEHFSAAHQLRDFKGVCENLHGHNWKVDVVVAGEKLDDIGILVDFHVIEKQTKELVDELDHRILNELPLFQDLNPSAENIARFLFEELKKRIASEPAVLKKVTVWETDTCGASYSC